MSTRPLLARAVEQLLKDHIIPYVSVAEVRRALSPTHASNCLRSFHFVVYRRVGANWLLFAAKMDKEARDHLAQWERIFGNGFKGVVARRTRDGTLRFRTLAGETLEFLEEQEPAASPGHVTTPPAAVVTPSPQAAQDVRSSVIPMQACPVGHAGGSAPLTTENT